MAEEKKKVKRQKGLYKKAKLRAPRGAIANRIKNLNGFGRLKFKLDNDCLLNYRSLEGTKQVPSEIVNEMVGALVTRNFQFVVEDEYQVSKFVIQLMSMLGLLAIYNSDKMVPLGDFFTFRFIQSQVKEDAQSRYVFSLRTTLKPRFLSSYLYNIIHEIDDQGEVADDTIYIEDLFGRYFHDLYSSSKERLEEL